MTATATLTGRCLCGAVTYEAGEPLMSALCHCEDCQRASGSPYSLNVVVTADGFALQGEEHLKTFETTGTDTGLPRQRVFCAECGSTLLTYLEEMEGMVVLKAGTLDDPSRITPELELWSERAQPWLAGDAERGVMPRGLET
ncbi:GFA family protein [Conexibacter sp. SYSU D00693]|uniref:GFA family protein n=1 Tax=Conexibacter sp. SYSU D00693 TaxID=2812560 RepID=UPI00196B4B90|nr:GFA family protein [Conexibacter sp. SYSU D00693]